MFAYAAYCPHDQIKAWKCTHCKQATSHNFKIAGFGLDEKARLFAYVGYDSQANEIIVAVRGTVEKYVQNIMEDLAAIKHEPYPLLAKGTKLFNANLYKTVRVALGFEQSWLKLRSTIDPYIKKLIKAHPKATLIITGHSLGGAIATFMAAYLASWKIADPSKMHLFTFGSPRCGNKAFVKWFNSLGLKASYRITNRDDIVPHLPPLDFGFHHIPREIWYNKDYKGRKKFPTSHRVCDGSGEDPSCADSVRPTKFSVQDHLEYFGVSEDGCKPPSASRYL